MLSLLQSRSLSLPVTAFSLPNGHSLQIRTVRMYGYGCHCGVGSDNSKPILDSLDHCCYHHDLCYTNVVNKHKCSRGLFYKYWNGRCSNGRAYCARKSNVVCLFCCLFVLLENHSKLYCLITGSPIYFRSVQRKGEIDNKRE